jgi:alpha-tubulin suppressor-like RCC1 family protein
MPCRACPGTVLRRPLRVGPTAPACALRDDGVILCAGSNKWGEAGQPSLDSTQVALPIDTSMTFKAVSAGQHHTCAVATDSTLWCWGSNDFGESGPNVPETFYGSDGAPIPVRTASPTSVSGSPDWDTVSAGGGTSCAIKLDGSLWCWGARIASTAFSPMSVVPGLP